MRMKKLLIYIFNIFNLCCIFLYTLTFLWIREINFALFNNEGISISKLLQVVGPF